MKEATSIKALKGPHLILIYLWWYVLRVWRGT